MTTASGYYCSFCKIALKTGKGWVHHLLSPDHQARAREDLISWDLQTKEHVLVVFGEFQVATEDVLSAFSDQNGKSSLSGFVWNEKRRRVGLLVFESREKMDEVLGPEMRIGNYQLLQLRRATDYLELEWEELMVREIRTEFNTGVKTEPESEVDDDQPSSSKRIKLDHYDESSSDVNEVEQDGIRRVIKVSQRETTPFNFSSQFDNICRDIEIGAGVYKEAVNIMERCQKILTEMFPSCGVYMFRNWYLKLRGQGVNELLFYIDVDGILGSESGGTVGKGKEPSLKDMKLLFESHTAQQLFPGLRCFQETCMDRALGFPDFSQLHFEDASSNLKFTLVNDPLYAVEAQTCRLLNYLLDFDPRARPFLTLIFYWAHKNAVKISDSAITRDDRHMSYSFAPEPAGLEWMVIFFLCHKGILPSPRKLREQASQSHPQVLYEFLTSKFQNRNDIGCRMDAEFAKEWAVDDMPNRPLVGSNEFVLHLVELSQQFLRFYGQLRSTPQQWVLNMKDGELLKKEDLLKSHPENFWTRLTKEELALIRNQSGYITKKHRNLNGLAYRRLTILHPLILQWTIPCDEDNFFGKISLQMLNMAERIEKWFPTLDASRVGNKTNITTLETLFEA